MEQDAHHRDGGEDADAQRHRPDQHLVGDGGDLIGQNLQVRLRDGDDRTHQKADGDDDDDAVVFKDSGADTLAQRGHGDFGTQLEKAHADNQQDRAHQKKSDGSNLQRHQHDA